MPAVPYKATYWAYMTEWADYLKEWLSVNNHPANDGGLANVYYDGELCAYRVGDYYGNYTLVEGFIDEAYLAYVPYYVIPANGSVSGFRNFTGGQLEDVLRNTSRATVALQSINLQLLNGAYVATGDCSSPDLSRECAYAIMTHINAQRAGIVLNAGQILRLAQLKTWAQGHVDAWINNTADYFRPFMGALTAQALINHYIYVSVDASTVTRLADLADYAWSSCWKATAGAWGQALSFLYTDRTGFNPDDGFVQPDLNMLIAPWWGWLYLVGAGATYRTQGDQIFEGGLPVYNGPFHDSGTYLGTRSAVNPSGKQYCQQLFWGPQYIEWAEAGDGAGTAYTSNATGNWSDSTKWTPNGVPGVGDTVTIAAGHTITVDGSQEIGTSPAAGVNVCTVSTTAILAITGSLRLRGDLKVNGTGRITSAAGSGFTFDSTLAAAPSTTNYKVDLGSANGNNCRWTLSGTVGSPINVSSALGGGNGYIDDGGVTEGGLVDATYVNFTRIGTVTVPAIVASATGSTIFRLDNCNLTGCGRIDRTFNIGADATYSIFNTTFASSIDSTGDNVILTSGAPIGTGTRRVIDSVFDLQFKGYSAEDFTFQRNFFNDGLEFTSGEWALFENCFVRFSASSPGPFNPAGSTDGCYFYYDNPTEWNPHFIQPLGFAANQTHNNNIFDMNCASVAPAQEGDCYTFATPGSACVATITNNIALVGPNNKTVGTMFTMLGNANTSVIAEHNTCFAGGQGAVVGETYAGFTGMVQSFRSNLVWSLTANNGYKLYAGALSVISNIVTAANCNYNGGYNLAVGNNTNNYNNLLFSAGTPGANDVSGNPGFADYTRNLRTWSTYRVFFFKQKTAYEILKADLATELPALYDYIRDGFTPTNAAYATAAHDGTTIGAVGYQVVNASMSVSPVTLVANTTGNVVTVTGVGTTWTAGTPGTPTFTISGVTGAAITAQVINSPVSATLTVTASTGGAIGVAEISDGTITAPLITVTPPTPEPGTPGQNSRRRPY